MSFILNALRKSEQERLSNHTEKLEDKILFKHGADQKNKPGWIVILILINFLLITILLWHFSQQEDKGMTENPVPVAKQLKTPVPVKEDNPVTVTGQTKTPVQIKDETVTVSAPTKDLVQVKQEKPLTIAEQANDPVQINQEKPVQIQDSRLINTPQVTIAQKINNHQEEKKNYRRRQASLKTKPITQTSKVNQSPSIVVKKSNPEQQEKNQKPALLVSKKENDPPYLSDMSYEFRLSVPSININVFVYTENPAGRFIMVNMHKYQIGQQINKEMQLQEIRPDSIVVEYQGKVFQIQR